MYTLENYALNQSITIDIGRGVMDFSKIATEGQGESIVFHNAAHLRMPKAVHVSAVHDFELREGLTVSQSPGYFQVNVSGAQISVIEYNPLQLAPFRIVSVTSLFIHQESIPYPRMDTIPLCHTGRIIPEGRKRRLIMRNINLTTGEEQQYDI